MKVEAVTVPDSASDPKHPEHDRWVKERTLKMEIEHAQAVGLPLSVAESENVRLLERAERIAAEQPAPQPKQKPKNIGHDARGVTKKSVAPEKPKRAGCRCGKCIGCKRTQRIVYIMQRGREDEFLGTLAKKLAIAAFQASGGAGQFKGLSKADRGRALNACIDAACDASVRLLGAWR